MSEQVESNESHQPADASDRAALTAHPAAQAAAPAAGQEPSVPSIRTAYPTAYDGSLRDDVSPADFLRVVYKRRWIATAAFVIVFVSAAVYTLTAVPLYEATARLLIEKENANVVNFKEAYEQNQIADDYYQTQYKILQSRALARRTIDALNLWQHPLVGGTARRGGTGIVVKLNAILTSVVTAIHPPKSHAPPVEPRGPSETAIESRAIDRFLSGLTIAAIRNSRLVDVKYQSPEPEFSAAAANALAKAYIEQNLEFKFQSSKEASDWLSERLGEQRQKVESSEVALQHYREQNDAVSLEERQNIVVQKLSDLNQAVTRAKTERIQKEALYNQLRAIENDRAALDTFPAILANAFIQQLKAQIAELQRQQAQLSDKLGPNHPDMVKLSLALQNADAKLRAEIAKVVESIRNEFIAARAQEQSLMAALEQQKHDALALNRKGIEYGVLQRDATSNRQIFESLMQRTKETGISGELKSSNIRIVDAAEVPRAPASPNIPLNLLLGLVGGLVLAIGLCFVVEYADNTIKTPDDVKSHLNLAYLGMVPQVFDAKIANPLINNGVPESFSESFRTVRSNVLFSSAEEGGRALVVTSAGPGEGKTIIASNLALALAQAGQRVLLIDADMRRPRMQSLFNLSKAPGLSSVIVGNAKPNDAVKPSGTAGLWLLPSGPNPPNPAELLGSSRFIEFLTMLKQHFNWVILDTPPVMAVTDSSVVAHEASGVLFVVGAEMTSRFAAQRAVEQLGNAKAKFLGAVLNKVDLHHDGYYYSRYYRREYGDYYTRSQVQPRH